MPSENIFCIFAALFTDNNLGKGDLKINQLNIFRSLSITKFARGRNTNFPACLRKTLTTA